MDKAYEPAKYEAEIYQLWEDSGAFKPTEKGSGKPFSIIMPPPNANGDLHVGHAMYVVEDIMIRYHRMKGDPTLWLPGADHAGIETQVVFERELAKNGKSRYDLGREEFYKQALAFTKQNMGNMTAQLRSLGFSADWSRFKFTLDPDIIDTVYDTFKKLHADDLIYRGNRIVNWCPHCRSGFADIEIKYRQQLDPLYYIKYGPFVLATVRPETKFGDTAVAVHPKDERYAKYVGKEIEAEGLNGPFKLKVIADDHVDPAFGTGVIKVTPAHDPNDWEIGLRHNLEVKQAIGTDGLMTALTGKYAGMPVAEAREQVAHDLQERGLMDHIDMNYSHSIATHDRCGTLIEPLVTEQWWLKVKPLVDPAIKAVKDGDIKIVPKRFEKSYITWLEGLRDWNISRQNWFGIGIPVFYESGVTSQESRKDPYIIGTEPEAQKYYGEGNYEAETDTFDTWFSSSQWPFATLMATGDMDRFYPTSVMETGRDILFLWVTRMVMLGLYRTGQVPFRTVYLHGLVNDAQGKKMSKSKGNVINPLVMTQKYGTDALRLALTIGITPGNDGALSEEKIAGYRNFNNKLWNVARFILDKVEAESRNPERSRGTSYSPTTPTAKSLADKWIFDRIAQESAYVSKAIDQYRFSEAGQHIYSLLWDDFADWYIEASKTELNLPVLVFALETILKLAHPFAPFVTEQIWQQMLLPTGRQVGKDSLLITSEWPHFSGTKSDGHDFEKIRTLVNETRSLSHDLGLTKAKLAYSDKLIGDNKDLIERLARVELVTGKVGIALTSADAWLVADKGEIEAARKRLESEKAEKIAYLDRLDKQLKNKQYLESAPATVVGETRDRYEDTKVLLSKLDDELKAIEKS